MRGVQCPNWNELPYLALRYTSLRDANLIIDQGIYQLSNQTTNLPTSGIHGLLKVFCWGAEEQEKLQEYMPYNRTQIYIRYHRGSTGWQPWQLVAQPIT